MHRYLLLLALVVPVVGCGRKPPPAPPAPPAVPITVAKPTQRAVKRVVEQPGTVRPFDETALSANASGYIDAIEPDPLKAARPDHDRLIDIDSRVTKDQVLARIAAPELVERAKQKDALVDQARAEEDQAKQALVAAGAGATAAEANVAQYDAAVERADALVERARKELDRVKKLVAGGMADTQTLDETQFQLKAAEATHKEAKARVAAAKAAVTKAGADRDKADADVTAATARLAVARAVAREAKEELRYLDIRAPYDGVVTRRAANRGDQVKAGDKVALFSVARVDPVRVVVYVPEADAGLVSAGQEVRLAIQAVQGPEVVGKVARTSWALEPGSRTLRTEIDLPNNNGLLRPGTYVHAKLSAELPAAWAVPAAAVGKVGDEPVMYLVENGKAARVAVQLLKGDGQFTQVRRYKRAGASDWTDVTGAEQVASPAAALTDGQAVP
ncbi:MAG: efflux RND transporter periplasmic adaptor subunit [Planctomycetes bacterium]|nr:efflux RND transporter periplasmic adaptor subunit [Planctomycetota bacterium]